MSAATTTVSRIHCIHGSLRLTGRTAVLTSAQREGQVELAQTELAALVQDCTESAMDEQGWHRAERLIGAFDVQLTVCEHMADPRFAPWAELNVNGPDHTCCTLMFDSFGLSQLRGEV